jgi:hypothetical protein
VFAWFHLLVRNGPSPCQLVSKFAARIAHLLNTGSDVVALNRFGLEQAVTKALCTTTYARLVGAGLVGPERDKEEIARKYIETVLERRLMLARNHGWHKGHELLLALCRRGVDAHWEQADLFRGNTKLPATGQQAPSSFDSVAARLAEIDKSVSPSNPATNTRERLGPLNLAAGGACAEVAEELSVWAAIACAPARLRKLPEGAPFDAFCSVVIKAVEAANAPFGALLTVGLSPYDWLGEISHNTVKALSRFLSRVRELSGEDTSGRGDLETWRRAWRDRRVPGFASADALWNSALGRAVRLPVVPQFLDWDEVDEGILQDGDMLEPASFEDQLAAARAAGVIEAYDVWLYREIRNGRTIAELERRPETLARIGSESLADYIEALTERLLAWARARIDPSR